MGMLGIVHPKLEEDQVPDEVEKIQLDLQEVARQLDRLEVEFSRFVHKASHGFFERRH